MNTTERKAVSRDLRDTARELLAAYASLVPFCRYNGLDVAEMQKVIDRAKDVLSGARAA
jgi:hypothetical protein